MSDQAKAFLAETNSSVKFSLKDTVAGPRKRYNILVTTPNAQHAFVFTDSIHSTTRNKKPTAYDFLAAVTKQEPDYPDDAIKSYLAYGYTIETSEDVDKAYALHAAIMDEVKKLHELWPNEEHYTMLEEIQ